MFIYPVSVFILIAIVHVVVETVYFSMPFEARVKSILSGDTVVLSNITNPSQERVLSLAYVSAPRLRREGDEVGALLRLIAR